MNTKRIREQVLNTNTLWSSVVGLCTVIVAMLGFYLAEGRHYRTGPQIDKMIEAKLEAVEAKAVSREELNTAIQTTAPYLRDRSMLLEAAKQDKEDRLQLRRAIENNTQAVIRLETTLETILRGRTDD